MAIPTVPIGHDQHRQTAHLSDATDAGGALCEECGKQLALKSTRADLSLQEGTPHRSITAILDPNKPVATPPCTSIRKPHRHPYHINTFPDLATQLSPSILVLSLETTTQIMTPTHLLRRLQRFPDAYARPLSQNLLSLLLSSASAPHHAPYNPIRE